MSDIFSNAFNGISNAIHDVGKSSIGQMAEAAALAYFMGPAGLELGGAGEAGLSFATRAGLAGGITNLLNGGNIGSALQAGAMGYGLAGLSGVGEGNPNAASVEVQDLSTAGEVPQGTIRSTTGINAPADVAKYLAPGPQFTGSGLPPDLQSLEPGPVTGIAPTINAPGVTPGSTQYLNAEAANPAPYNPTSVAPAAPVATPAAAPAAVAPTAPPSSAASVAQKLTENAKPTTLYQDFKNLSPYTKAAIGIGGLGLLKAAAKPQPLNYRTPNNQQLRYFGGNAYSGPSNMYQTSAGATGGLVALAEGGGIHHFDDGGLSPVGPMVNSVAGTPQYTSYTPQEMQNYIRANQIDTSNPQQLAAAEAATNADPNAVNSYLASLRPTAIPTLNQDLTGVTNPTVQQMQAGEANVQAQNQAGNYVNNLLSNGNNAANVESFQAGNANDKNALIQKAVNNVLTEFGGNTPQAQATIAQLMNEFKVDPNTLGTAINVPVSTVQADYNAATAGLGASAPYYAALSPASTQASGIDLLAIQQAATQAGLDNPKSYTSMAQVLNDIAAKKSAVTKVTPTSTLTPTPTSASTLPGTISVTKTQMPETKPVAPVVQTYTPGYISNTTTNPTSAPGVGGSHAFIDTNGYVSQRAQQVGQPTNAQGFLGNYTSVQQMQDAYTKAGGSLGYTNPTGKTYTTDAGTQNVLDMLSGKKPYSNTPYTPTGEVFKPYYTSVMGMKENPVYTISQPYVFDPTSKTYVKNPQFDPNFSATADYIGAYTPGYKGAAVPALSQKTLDYLSSNGVSAPATAATAAASAPTTNASGQLVVKGQAYPTGSYIAGNGHLMVPDGGQDSNGQPTYNDLGIAAAGGGLMGLAAGGMSGMSVGHLGGYSDGGRLLRGPGDGVSDSIPATIGSTNPEPARLADGEFVVPARIVSELGNGSTEAGARQLYKMMDRIQHARRKTVGKEAVAANTNSNQYLPA
jgi:hypothetical protein